MAMILATQPWSYQLSQDPIKLSHDPINSAMILSTPINFAMILATQPWSEQLSHDPTNLAMNIATKPWSFLFTDDLT